MSFVYFLFRQFGTSRKFFQMSFALVACASMTTAAKQFIRDAGDKPLMAICIADSGDSVNGV